MRRPPPVVRPEWIVKSIDAKKVLPVQSFLYQAFADPTQGSVLSSLSLSAASSSFKSQGHSPATATNHQQREVAEERGNIQETCTEDQAEDEHHSFSESEGASDEEDHVALASQYASQHAEAQGVRSGERSLTVHHDLSDGHRTNSTRDGPSFVRHFFAKSRLHHIGSWRTTFQLRAGEFLSKYKGRPFRQEPSISSDRVILHVDMDCFFVSVAVRDKPQYDNLPIAIAHSGNAGSSEISSCNYLARGKGIRAGMFMQLAKKLCPELVVLPYQFEEIEACSFQIYDIFFSHTPYVQAMSCDEAYLEFGKDTDGVAMAKEIRQAIYETTRCTASVGISYNILLAKLATREAKPNGLFQIANPEQAEPFLQALQISDLPGVGHRMTAKMDELGLDEVQQLRSLSKAELVQRLGKATGETLFNYARGIDHRPLSVESNMMRKSVSAVVNFGIRFQTWKDATEFVMALAEELSSRLQSLKVRAKCLTLLIKKRREGAPVEPGKFMGMGVCDSFSKSQILFEATDSDLLIGRTGIELLRQFSFPVEELRGVGIQATKLVSGLTSVESRSGERFRAWLADSGRSEQLDATEQETRGESRSGRDRYTESFSQINMDVLDELPPDIREEVLSSYRNHRPPPAPANLPLVPPPSRAKGKQKLGTHRATRNRVQFPAAHESTEASDSMNSMNTLNDIRMSQIDEEVYNALPITLRREIDGHTKRSKGATNKPKPIGDSQVRAQPVFQQKVSELKTIEELVDALAEATAYLGADADAVGVRGAFDAIFSRVLVDVEGRALDKALRMLRFVRRKCGQLVVSSEAMTAELVRGGFNHILQQINGELQQQYQSRVPVRVVAPL
jgi:DNA repair protein REV1